MFKDYIMADDERVDKKRYECLHDEKDLLVLKCMKCGKTAGNEFRAIKLPKYIKKLIESHIRTLA